MKQLFLVVVISLVFAFGGSVFADNDYGYPYDITEGCTQTCYADSLGFCQNNCTSYAAYVLNQVYGIPFTNYGYRVSSYNDCSQDNKWGNGGCWDNAARNASIPVDNYPLPGDIAYWNTLGGVGHVAWVEKVYFDSNGNATSVDVTEYNINECDFGSRNVSAGNPDGYIHILAYEEGVTSFHYLDCYEMGNICDNQTPEEWERIAARVWNEYRCTSNCDSNYDLAYVGAIATGFGGGVTEDPSPSDPPPNLHIEEQKVFDSSNNLLADNGTGTFTAGSQYKVEVWVESLVEHCGNGTNDWTQEVKTDIFWKIGVSEDDGDWELLQREYTTCEIMDEDDSKREDHIFIVPVEAQGKRIFIKAKVDVENIIYETDETDNWDDTETYQVSGTCANCPDFIVINAALSQGKTELDLDENFGLEMDILNQGAMASPSDIRSAYYTKAPSQTSWQYRADDESGASNLDVDGTDHEYTQDAPFTANEVGTWQAMICAEYLGEVSETNETNNCATFTFEVADPNAPITGDFDGDFDVDNADYVIFQTNYGSTQCGNIADLNGDCNVNIFDYSIFVSNYTG